MAEADSEWFLDREEVGRVLAPAVADTVNFVGYVAGMAVQRAILRQASLAPGAEQVREGPGA